jgi:hypothetical protein
MTRKSACAVPFTRDDSMGAPCVNTGLQTGACRRRAPHHNYFVALAYPTRRLRMPAARRNTTPTTRGVAAIATANRIVGSSKPNCILSTTKKHTTPRPTSPAPSQASVRVEVCNALRAAPTSNVIRPNNATSTERGTAKIRTLSIPPTKESKNIRNEAATEAPTSSARPVLIRR